MPRKKLRVRGDVIDNNKIMTFTIINHSFIFTVRGKLKLIWKCSFELCCATFPSPSLPLSLSPPSLLPTPPAPPPPPPPKKKRRRRNKEIPASSSHRQPQVKRLSAQMLVMKPRRPGLWAEFRELMMLLIVQNGRQGGGSEHEGTYVRSSP